MRHLIFGFLLIFSLVKINNKSNKVQKHNTRDTIFILKEKTNEYYHKIYIEQNRQSALYTDLTDFKMDKYDLETYKVNYQSLGKRFESPLKRYNLSGLPKDWIPLYKYKNKYYIYYPSERGYMGRRIITDSTLVYWFMDGPYPQPLLSAKRINEKAWSLNVNSPFEGRPDARLTLHVIDPKNKITVWEDSSQPKTDRYELYIPKENAKNFDIIVNYCEQNRTDEFIFDKIDYSALLKSHKLSK